MDVYEIQTRVLECLRKAGVPRVLKTKTYSVSNVPTEAGQRVVKQNTVIVSFVASFEEFMTFRACVNEQEVWVSPSWRPFGETERFIYEVFAVEKR